MGNRIETVHVDVLRRARGSKGWCLPEVSGASQVNRKQKPGKMTFLCATTY
jgi:hypothetical protein